VSSPGFVDLRRDFDTPNTFAVRFSLVQFGSLWSHVGSLWFNMASVDIINLRISMIIPIITNYSSIGEAAWQ